MSDRGALLLDGGLIKKKLKQRLGRFPAVADVVALVDALMGQPRLRGAALLHVYYYDAPPYEGTARNPIDGSVTSFSTTRRPRPTRP